MQLKITYWQCAQYELTVDPADVLPAMRYYEEKIGGEAIRRALADLEAGRVPPDTGIIGDALTEDGQMTAGDFAEKIIEWAPPEDYTVEVVR
jgi:hypothetical protein